MLELHNVSLQYDRQIYVDEVNLELRRGEINILLGPTLSGKTSLMRLMAGLEQPDSGEILFDGESVLGVSVQRRNVAMVYQQFINYPTLTVFENIASPLRVARLSTREIETRVAEVASLLQIEQFLSRYPDELSGGQQQRVALARALVKKADLVLLDEPLANLDYKLREELRGELPQIIAELGAVVVYATTDPTEALVLGGLTACLHEGRVQQFGETLELYNNPGSLQTAKTFSDPPLNVATIGPTAPGVPNRGDSACTLGIRPHHLSIECRSDDDLEFRGIASVTEFTGSESFIHFQYQDKPWVALVHGIVDVQAGQELCFYANSANAFYFDDSDRLLTDISYRGAA